MIKGLLSAAAALVLSCSAVFGTAATAYAAAETNSLVQEVDLDQLTQFSESMIQSFASMTPEQLELQAKLYDLNGNKNLANSYTNYEQQTDDLGAFQQIISGQSEKTKDGYLSTIQLQYEKKTMKAEIGYDEDLPYWLMMYQQSTQGVSGAYLNSLTDTTFTPAATIAENTFSGLANMIVGMGTVFVVLIFFTWVIGLLKYVNRFDPEAKKKLEAFEEAKAKTAASKAAAAAAPVRKAPAPAPAVPAAPAPAVQAAGGDGVLAAVIAAAIAAYEADNGGAPTLNNGIRIRSIRRHKDSGWNRR